MLLQGANSTMVFWKDTVEFVTGNLETKIYMYGLANVFIFRC